ncbi:MAG: MCE family protein [Candidatus Tectomicrobia bacterium]|uniref:MCE family protein n=1 Tax=Tectimicrobiota bacterium TaxID=2528274 RepID=A0A932GNB8_UNCTE|nr:MCE family protein [Candidatus Tectomicrobia bacterium]
MARKGLSPEAKVGLFVLAGIILLTYMTVRLGEIRIGKKPGYLISAVLDTVAGLDVKAPVKVAGVRVGEVEKIDLVNGKAQVTMRIDPKYQIKKNAAVTVRTQGLLGEKYIEITEPVQKAQYLKPGESIQETRRAADFDELVTRLTGVTEDVKELTSSLKTVFGSREGEESLKRILANVDALAANLNQLVISNRQNLTALVNNLNEAVALNKDRFNAIMNNTEVLTQSLKTLVRENEGPLGNTLRNLEQFSATLKQDTPGLVKSLDNLSTNLQGVVTENRENLKQSMENLRASTEKLEKTLESLNTITGKIERGEGTIGKLVTEDTTYKNLNETLTGVNKLVTATDAFKFTVGLRGEYQARHTQTKGYFSLKIQPREDKYYLLEIVDDPRGKTSTVQTRAINNGIETLSSEERTSRKIKFSAEYAKRFYNTVVRGGLIESTFGAGVDQLFLKDRLTLSLEGFEFNPDRTRDREPNLKLTSRYDLYKPFFVNAGVDQILNRRLRTFFLGGGFAFDDEDLKYLLTRVPVPSR